MKENLQRITDVRNTIKSDNDQEVSVLDGKINPFSNTEKNRVVAISVMDNDGRQRVQLHCGVGENAKFASAFIHKDSVSMNDHQADFEYDAESGIYTFVEGSGTGWAEAYLPKRFKLKM